MARKTDEMLRNRIRLNAGRYSVKELAWVLGVTIASVEKMAERMKLSLKVVK